MRRRTTCDEQLGESCQNVLTSQPPRHRQSQALPTGLIDDRQDAELATIKQFTVAAGTYDTIPVKCDRYSPTTMRLLEQREWDYAPELGHYVRRVTVNYLRGTTRTAELVAALSGPAASKARIAAIAREARAARAAARASRK